MRSCVWELELWPHTGCSATGLREGLANGEKLRSVRLCPITDPRVVDSIGSIDAVVLEEC